MKSVMKKWGKEIAYSISNEASWMVIKDGAFSWIYVTKKDIDDSDLVKAIRTTGVRPDFVKRRGMLDLLIHFGIDGGEREALFDKGESDVSDNV
jgi:hypothetical protein